MKKSGLILPPSVPQVGGPETEKAKIGGTGLEFFAQPEIVVQIPPPEHNAQVPGFFHEIAQRLTMAGVCINAFCREFVAQRALIEEQRKIIDQLQARVDGLEANAITKVERIVPDLSPGDSGELG